MPRPKRERAPYTQCETCHARVDGPMDLDANDECAECAAAFANLPADWRPALCQPERPVAGAHTPTVLRYVRDTWMNPQAERAGCFCGWMGPVYDYRHPSGENARVEEAHDHAFPGWRNCPVIVYRIVHDGGKGEREAMAKLRREIEPLYPPGWFDRGGPMLTVRVGIGTRHVDGYAPGGGYDICARVTDEATEAPTEPVQDVLF